MKNSNSVRKERVSSLLKEEISKILHKRFNIHDVGLITVTDVEMTKDLRTLKVFVSIMGENVVKERNLKILEHDTPSIREELGHKIRLRFTPSVLFVLDESLDRAINIAKLLNQIHNERKERGIE